MNNSSLTFKWAHVSSASDSNISRGSLTFLQFFFPLTAPIEFPNVKETEKGLKPTIVLSSCDLFFSLHKYYLANPNGESVSNWISYNISNCRNSQNWVVNVVLKFHNDQTVNESEIVIFLRHVRWPTGKREGFWKKREKWNCEAEEAKELVWKLT